MAIISRETPWNVAPAVVVVVAVVAVPSVVP